MPQMFKRESFASVVTSCSDGCECFTCSRGFDNGNKCLSQVYTLLQTSGICCSVHLTKCEQKNAALQAQQAGRSFSETSDDDIEVQLAGRRTCVAESPILSSQRKTNKSYNVFSGMSSWNSLANQFSTKVRSNLHECSSSIGCYFSLPVYVQFAFLSSGNRSWIWMVCRKVKSCWQGKTTLPVATSRKMVWLLS